LRVTSRGLGDVYKRQIPGHTKLRIIDSLQTKVEKLAKMKFHTMMIEDGMTNAIRNVEIWLKEITQKLDQFTLQD
jgi:hypothetical protein